VNGDSTTKSKKLRLRNLLFICLALILFSSAAYVFLKKPLQRRMSINAMASHATIIPSQFSETVVLRVIGCGKIEFPSFEIEIDTSTAPVELRYLGSTNEWITEEQNEFQFLNVIPRSRNHRQGPDLSLKFNKPE